MKESAPPGEPLESCKVEGLYGTRDSRFEPLRPADRKNGLRFFARDAVAFYLASALRRRARGDAMETACTRGASAVAVPGPRRTRYAARAGSAPRRPRRASRRRTAVRAFGGDEDARDAAPFLVPRDCFTDGTFPPEAKAASSMRLLFTMVALRVVLAQEEGFGNECHDDPSFTELYDDLTTYLQREPLKDPEAWIEKLLRHPKLQCRLAAVRIIEVRDVYASREFDWGEMRAIALEEMEACRRTLVAQHLARSAS